MQTIEGKYKVTSYGMGSYVAREILTLSAGAIFAALTGMLFHVKLTLIGMTSLATLVLSILAYFVLDWLDARKGGRIE